MNLCFVMESFTLGGVEKVSYQLLKNWQTQYPECKLHLKVLSDKGELAPLFNELNNVVVSKIEGFWQFRKYCLKHNIDCVIFTKGGISRYSLLLPGKVKTYSIQHVPINLPQVSNLKNKLRMLGAAFFYRMVDQVVCVSHGIRENLIEKLRLNPHRVTTIYNAVIDETTNALAKQPVEYQDYYVFVGRLSYQKGNDMLLNSLALVVKKAPEIKVVIIGDGEDRQSFIEQIKALKLDQNVILHGFSDNPYKYIKNAKALLLPSRWEGLPTVLVEAAYLGTQIISFDCRYGPSELTANGKYGYLIEQDNIREFADAIYKIEQQELLPNADVSDFTGRQATANYFEYTKSLIAKL